LQKRVVARLAIALLLSTAVVSAAPRHKRRVQAQAQTQVQAQVSLDLPAPPPPAVIEPPPPLPPPPPPPRDAPGRERRWGLFGGGLAMFLVGYGLDIGISYGLGHNPAATSLIPIAGPLVQMGDSWAMVAPSNSGNPQIDGPANERIASVNHTIQTAAYAVLAVDFALQLAGATMVVVGVVGRTPAYESRRVAVVPTANGFAVRF
jgi:hypothetical protein